MPRPRNEFARRLGRNLARARKQTGLSQEELAFRASLHRTEIGLLERGERIARSDALFKLACGLSLLVSVFFEGMTWEAPQRTLGTFEFE